MPDVIVFDDKCTLISGDMMQWQGILLFYPLRTIFFMSVYVCGRKLCKGKRRMLFWRDICSKDKI